MYYPRGGSASWVHMINIKHVSARTELLRAKAGQRELGILLLHHVVLPKK